MTSTVIIGCYIYNTCRVVQIKCYICFVQIICGYIYKNIVLVYKGFIWFCAGSIGYCRISIVRGKVNKACILIAYCIACSYCKVMLRFRVIAYVNQDVICGLIATIERHPRPSINRIIVCYIIRMKVVYCYIEVDISFCCSSVLRSDKVNGRGSIVNNDTNIFSIINMIHSIVCSYFKYIQTICVICCVYICVIVYKGGISVKRHPVSSGKTIIIGGWISITFCVIYCNIENKTLSINNTSI